MYDECIVEMAIHRVNISERTNERMRNAEKNRKYEKLNGGPYSSRTAATDGVDCNNVETHAARNETYVHRT